MAITASQVKELRELSGAGMMDCKKALTATDGDMEAAIEYLRKNGVMKAEKKSSRITAEGICYVAVDGDSNAAIVEVNSETDFVAKNEKFQSFVAGVANKVLASDAADVEALLAESWDAEKTVKDELTSQIATIGENLSIRRFAKVSADCVVSYIHAGGKIGVVVAADTDVVNDDIKTCLKDVAMQIAAMNPKYISRDEVPAELVERESHVIKEQVMQEGKPEAIAEKMVTGRLNKFYKEICLEEQAFIKDSGMSVLDYVKSNNGSIVKMVRFAVGEGIEKKEEDFASEVMSQIENA